MRRPQRAYKNSLVGKQSVVRRWKATLGLGNGTVEVAGRENYVYARMPDGHAIQAFNNKVPLRDNLPVWVVGIPRVWMEIQGTASDEPLGPGGGAGFAYPPASYYGWSGYDPLYVHKRQFLPLRIGQKSGMVLKVYQDTIWGTTGFIGIPTQDVDMTAHIPATSGNAALVLITIDTSGTVVATKGAEYALASITDAASVLANLPAVPADTRKVLGACRVYAGQTEINEAGNDTDIWDSRWSGWEEAQGGTGTIGDHDHSGDSGDGGAFPLTNLLSTGAANGKTPTANGSGGITWETPTAAAEAGAEFIPDYQPGPRMETVSVDGYAASMINAMGFRYSALISREISGVLHQVCIFWDKNGKLVIGKRKFPGPWTLYTYNGAGGRPNIAITADLDTHRSAVVGIDPDGYIHIAYNMHAEALNYRKSNLPVTTWTGALGNEISMLGTNETSVTYPEFANGANGKLYFLFRAGSSGNGNLYLYAYNEGAGTWGAATGTGTAGLLIQGTTTNPTHSPYWHAPYFDPDGNLHLFYFWTEAQDISRHDLGYVKWDGTNWTKADGTAQTIPITPANDDPFDPVGDGVANAPPSATGTAVDANNHPHTVYNKLDAGGHYSAYHAWYNGTAWIITQLTFTNNNAAILAERYPPDIVIDRDSNVAYVFYRNPLQSDGITLLTSAPGDFATWTTTELDPTNAGPWRAKHDPYQWEHYKRIQALVEYYTDGQANLPIYMLSYTPSGFALLDAAGHPNLHTNDTDTAANSLHHTLGTGANQAAAGDHTHAGGSLTVKEVDGTPSVANVTEIKVTNGSLTDNTGGSVTLDFGAATDGAAIHDNVSGEIAAIAEKATPVAADLILIEDSADANAKKRVQIGNLPGGVGGYTERARVYHAAGPQTTTTSVIFALAFDTERYDTDTMHSPSTNTSRLTATTAGVYHIGGTCAFAGNATGYRDAIIRLNGTTSIARQRTIAIGTSVVIVNVSTDYALGAGDYVELCAFQNSGGNLDVNVLTNYSPEFWIHRIG